VPPWAARTSSPNRTIWDRTPISTRCVETTASGRAAKHASFTAASPSTFTSASARLQPSRTNPTRLVHK
jgi:hypothetical protein